MKSKAAQERAILRLLADGERRTPRDIALALGWPDEIKVATRCEKMRDARLLLGGPALGYSLPALCEFRKQGFIVL